MGSGHIRRKYSTDDEAYKELDTSIHPPQAEETKKLLTEETERLLNKTLQTYENFRRSVNEEQKLSKFGDYCRGDFNYADGKCSVCGIIQPWAKPWKPRYGLFLFFSRFVYILMSVIAIGFMAALFSGELLGCLLCVLAFAVVVILGVIILNKINDKIITPQFDARDKAICEEMRRSPYYKRSYPYVAREDDILDLDDERARRMAAEFSKRKDNATKLIFACDNCSRIVYAGLQMKGKPCICPKCGGFMVEKGSTPAAPHDQRIVGVTADTFVTSWVCAKCGTSNLERIQTCQGCGVTKAWSDSRTKK